MYKHFILLVIAVALSACSNPYNNYGAAVTAAATASASPQGLMMAQQKQNAFYR
jgi:hypothetical protein